MDLRPSYSDRVWLLLANASVLVFATGFILFVALVVAAVVWDFGPMVPAPPD
jgi:hypothetical protein